MAFAVASRVVSPARALARSLARLIVLWHLLSLDAPTVAVVWAAAIAHFAGITLPASSLVAMFLAVWILYAADRLLDSSDSASKTGLEPRHHFHSHHRGAFRLVLIAASLVLAPVLLMIPAASMRLYLLLAAMLFAWLLLVHVPPAIPKSAPRRLPKEFVVGPFFAAATFIPTVARAPVLRLHLLPQASLFAILCSLNCLLIYAWEHPTLRSRASAHPSTRCALGHLTALAVALLGAALTLALVQRAPLGLAIVLSAAALLALDRWPPRDPTLLRAAADLALLTPLLFL